jgi:penicillin-binding protein 2
LAAEEFKKRPALVETTRGRLLDRKGHELALDEACMDACIDYRAIARNEKWMQDVARARLQERTPDEYKKADKQTRQQMLERETEQVRIDIDAMFERLASQTGESPEKIDVTCRQIKLRIEMRSRLRQYRRFLAADKEHDADGNAPWYRRWLIEGGKDGPQVDDFEETEEEEVTIHPVVRNISPDAYLQLARLAPVCPGLSLRPGTHRKYPYGAAGCHVLGTLAPVTKSDIEADPNLAVDALREYQFNDYIGRSGLEALCEPSLRGTRGRVFRRAGREDELDVSPLAGKDVRTTIDIDLQDQIQKMFAEMEVPSNIPEDKRTFKVAMHGAAVVIDVKTGAVRALASYPDYDVNQLGAEYENLVADEDNTPLLNRATQAQLEPGSTVKPIVGIAAITQGLPVPPWGKITTHTGIECTGYLVINGHKITNGRCWVASKYGELMSGRVAHHPVPSHAPHRGVHGNPNGYLCFADAIERSCNVYFETIADGFGIEGLTYWYDRFGLGHETGLGIGESCGFLPNSLRVRQVSDAWFSGIGQVGVRVTPVQMANVAATIARDGVWVRPRLVEDAVALSPTTNRGNRQLPDRMDLQLSKEAVAAARDGMVRVVNSEAGTGEGARMSELLVAGKTGTAQASSIRDKVVGPDGNYVLDKDGHIVTSLRDLATADRATPWPWYRGWGKDGTDKNHAWFIGYAPADNPQVAFAVMVQYGGSGGTLAAHTATKILSACIEHDVVKLR